MLVVDETRRLDVILDNDTPLLVLALPVELSIELFRLGPFAPTDAVADTLVFSTIFLVDCDRGLLTSL